MAPGVLTAERDGPHVRLHMDYDGDAFMVERYDGMTDQLDSNNNPVLDDNGHRIQVEVWTPIHSGTAKQVEGDTDYELAFDPNDPTAPHTPLPSPRTYRALALHRFTIPGTQVRSFTTDGIYTDPVTI